MTTRRFEFSVTSKWFSSHFCGVQLYAWLSWLFITFNFTHNSLYHKENIMFSNKNTSDMLVMPSVYHFSCIVYSIYTKYIVVIIISINKSINKSINDSYKYLHSEQVTGN